MFLLFHASPVHDAALLFGLFLHVSQCEQEVDKSEGSGLHFSFLLRVSACDSNCEEDAAVRDRRRCLLANWMHRGAASSTGNRNLDLKGILFHHNCGDLQCHSLKKTPQQMTTQCDSDASPHLATCISLAFHIFDKTNAKYIRRF